MRESLDLEQKTIELSSMCSMLRSSIQRMLFVENNLRSYRNYQHLQATKIAHLKIAKNTQISIQKIPENKRFKAKSKFSFLQDRPFVPDQQPELEGIVAKEKILEKTHNLENLRDSKSLQKDNLQTENSILSQKIESSQSMIDKQNNVETFQKKDCDFDKNEDLINTRVDIPLKENVVSEANVILGIDNLKIEESFEQQSGSKRNNSDHTDESSDKRELRYLGKQRSSRIHKGRKDSNTIARWSPFEMSPLRKCTPRKACMPYSQEFNLEMSKSIKSRFQFEFSDKKITEKEYNSFSQCLNRTSYRTSSSWVQQSYSNQNNCSMSQRREIGFYSSPQLEKIETNYLESYYQQHKGLRGECRCLHCNNNQFIPQPFSATIPFERINQPSQDTPWSNFLVKVENYRLHSSSPDCNKSVFRCKSSPIKEHIEPELDFEHNMVKVETVESETSISSEQESLQPQKETKSTQLLSIKHQKFSEAIDSKKESDSPLPAFVVRKGKMFPSVIYIEGNKKFQCQICQKTFDSKQKLGGHKARSHPDAPCQRTEREKKRKYFDQLEINEKIKNITKYEESKKQSFKDNKGRAVNEKSILSLKLDNQDSKKNSVSQDKQNCSMKPQETETKPEVQLSDFKQKNEDIFSENIKYPAYFAPLAKQVIQKQKAQQQQKQERLKSKNKGKMQSESIDEEKQEKVVTTTAREEEQVLPLKLSSESSKVKEQALNGL